MPSSLFYPIEDGSYRSIDHWHAKCHEGDVFGWHYENLALASSGTVYIHIKTGAKDVHFGDEFAALGGIMQIQWYGTPTVGTAGTSIECINRNRHYRSTAALTTMDVGPTVSTVGTVLFGARCILGSSSAQSKVGANIVGAAERILRPSTDYLIKFTAIGAISLTADGLFYEVAV